MADRRAGRSGGSKGRARTPAVSLVLAGGNAMGAFEAGACQGLHEAGVRPEWTVGTSIGAVNAALVAGNAEDDRVAALDRFWKDAELADLFPWPLPAEPLHRLTRQVQALLFGNPAIFSPRYGGAHTASPPARIGLHDLAPLRRHLERLVDFDRLNDGPVRYTCQAVDLESGATVLFDSRTQRIGPEHVAASCALVPEFRPVEIDGRLYGDGGLGGNLPLDAVTRADDWGGVCIVVDPFNAAGRLFESLSEAAARRFEILFATQTRRQIETHERETELRHLLADALGRLPAEARDDPALTRARDLAGRRDVDVVEIVWRASDEVGIRLYDYSRTALTARWSGGVSAARDLVAARAAAGLPL